MENGGICGSGLAKSETERRGISDSRVGDLTPMLSVNTTVLVTELLMVSEVWLIAGTRIGGA